MLKDLRGRGGVAYPGFPGRPEIQQVSLSGKDRGRFKTDRRGADTERRDGDVKMRAEHGVIRAQGMPAAIRRKASPLEPPEGV